MSVSNALIFVLLDYEVIVNVALDGHAERSKNRAPVSFASQGANQPLRINVQAAATVGFRTLNHLDAKAGRYSNFFYGHDNRHHRELRHSVYVLLLPSKPIEQGISHGTRNSENR